MRLSPITAQVDIPYQTSQLEFGINITLNAQLIFIPLSQINFNFLCHSAAIFYSGSPKNNQQIWMGVEKS